MAKTMARIKDDVVINLVWVDDSTVETQELRNTYDLMVNIGDTYSNRAFYRNGKKLLTFREQLRKNIDDYNTILTDIAAALSVPMPISEETTLSIEERKTAILLYIDMLNEAIKSINKGGL